MPSPEETGRALRARFEQFRRFAEWEAREEERTARSFEADLAWLADAMALARQLDSEWGGLARVRERAARRARDRAVLAILGERAA